MIKFDTSEIDKFVIDLKGTSEDIRSDIQKVLKKSGFNIEAKAKLNITNNGSVNRIILEIYSIILSFNFLSFIDVSKR